MSRPKIRKLNLRIELAAKALAVAAAMAPAATPAMAAGKPAQPKLVVGIMVEDLRSEYIDLLKEYFSAGGFNKLLTDGVVISNADFGAPMDPTAATAVIYTGAAPSVNGVPADEVFDRSTLRGVSVFTDPEARGLYTTQTLSPASLAVTTIADEARVAGGGVTYAYAVAPDPGPALIMAGHAANCGMWIDDPKEAWASTSYYTDHPSTLASRNRMAPLAARIDTMQWSPMLARDKYILLPDHATKYPFRYLFRQPGPQKMQAFKQSPKVNDEVTSFAIENLQSLRLGQHDGPDMLSVGYTLEPYGFSNMVDNRYELYDAYYRLDKNFETLFSAIDRSVGLDNTLIFVAATPPAQRSRRDDDKWRLPYGEFSTRKALSLLNLYLIAKYGNGDWANGYHRGQLYLNHKQIEQSGKSIEEVRTEAARFMERMSGVNKAYTFDEIIDGRSSDTAPLRQNTSVERAGDVWVQVMPGWQIIDDFNDPNPPSQQVERAAASMAPVFIMAPGVAPRTIGTTVDARAIAPTITRLLRIRSPNAAAVAPIQLQ